jgi:hypothetical protein
VVETPRSVAWLKEGIAGIEFVDVTLSANSLSASGVAIAADPLPHRVDYTLDTGDGFVTSRLNIATQGQGWRRTLDLRRNVSGEWTAETTVEGEIDLPPPGGDMALVRGALDCDLAWSPLTNSMPVLREGFLDRARSRDFLMAWVSLPDLGVRPSRQRYVAAPDVRTSGVVRYESLDSTFTADLTFDRDGLVIAYPGLGHRLG